jgi:hypothetical protein
MLAFVKEAHSEYVKEIQEKRVIENEEGLNKTLDDFKNHFHGTGVADVRAKS